MFKTFSKLLGNRTGSRKLVLAVNIALWKRDFFRKLFQNSEVIFVPLKDDINSYARHLERYAETEIVVWGYRECRNLEEFAAARRLAICRLEDGFVRGKGLGIQHNLPYSLCFDRHGLYFDAREASDFERLAQDHETVLTAELLNQSRHYLEVFREKGITKYLLDETFRVDYPPKPSCKRRILVIGQSEGDASIRYSLSEIRTNWQLLAEVRKRHPQDQIVFKQHPDETFRGSCREELKEKCDLFIDFPADFDSLMQDVDLVYTISSLLGFELLLRGARVRVFGMPFYAGWGLTEDELPLPRRSARLSLEELFALTYMVYPKYYDSGFREISFSAFIEDYLARKEGSGPDARLPEPRKPQTCGAGKSGSLGARQTAGAGFSDGMPDAAGGNARKNDGKERSGAAFDSKKAADRDVMPDSGQIPAWLLKRNTWELSAALSGTKPVYVYLPWIHHHTDALMREIASDHYRLVPLNLVSDLDSDERVLLSRFSRQHPAEYRRYILARLLALKGKIRGLIVTFDWAPVTRIAVEAANALGIATYLIPHEFVFINSDLYYRHPVTCASVPVAGELVATCPIQKRIFQSRGYPEDRIVLAGNPKLDRAVSYRPLLARRQFCDVYGLDPSLPIVLFSCQNLDIQIDTKAASRAQNQTLRDLARLAELLDFQLMIRLPPSGKNVIFDSTSRLISDSPRCVTDMAPAYLVPPAEAIWHSRVTVSMNSTMLLEAVLMNRHALSARYVQGINSIWRPELIPTCADAREMFHLIQPMLKEEFAPDEPARRELARLREICGATGAGAEAIRKFLESRLQSAAAPDLNAGQAFWRGERLDVLRIASSEATFNTTQKYLRRLLNCNTLLGNESSEPEELSAVRLFVQWGLAPCKNKEEQRRLASLLGRSVVYVEDGFVRSVDIGLSGTPALSIIRDDLTLYYDATKPSRLETMLTSDAEFSDEEKSKARMLMEKIVSLKISKYNSGRLGECRIPGDRKKLLLVDQRFGDWSVIRGMGSESVFDRMLEDALDRSGQWDIVIKQHPDALKGGKASYFSNDRIESALRRRGSGARIEVVREDVNPYCLLQAVDEVFVCTSSMGFEALMAGVPVTCYGMPWYAGYGLTRDMASLDRRRRQRSLEELFVAAYLRLSAYFNPATEKNCDLEELLDYIAEARKEVRTS